MSAKDYIVCTTKQIIVVNREMLGATANIKQFYYEDITSASTEQNAKSSDFTTALLETAITAATKTCDLIISVAGATTKIDTLFKVEAERVVAYCVATSYDIVMAFQGGLTFSYPDMFCYR